MSIIAEPRAFFRTVFVFAGVPDRLPGVEPRRFSRPRVPIDADSRRHLLEPLARAQEIGFQMSFGGSTVITRRVASFPARHRLCW